ncbi:MAG TPA: TIM-barrel domain-containing protein [Povalibacter sp.]|nr:TIM-barrel domain-containing protein [Povalibacter sp.]
MVLQRRACGSSSGLSALRYPLSASILLTLLATTGCAKKPENFQKTADGIVVMPTQGNAKRVRLQVMSDRIIRVTAVPGESLQLPDSLAVVAKPASDAKFTVDSANGKVVLKTGQVTAEVALESGVVNFLDASGKPVLSERDSGSFEPVKIGDRGLYRIHLLFNPGTDEGFYGLGQHQNAVMNYNGEDVELAQHNMDIAVPFVMSTRNYGVLWDTPSITRFGDPRPYGLASRDLTLYDADGNKGGLTATYSINGVAKVKRVEPDINYHFVRDLANRPQEVLSDRVSQTSGFRTDLPGLTAVWEGRMESAKTGVHKFQLFAGSYYKLYADDKLIVDGWRQNWNAWYHNFELPMAAGQPVKLRVEWVPNDSHIALMHNDPLPDAERHSLSLSSEATPAIDYYFVSGANMDEIIGGYRTLTGKAAMMPRWALGFWQSRQRYTSQTELLGIAKEYRKRALPFDNIVQDWFYWKEDQWGSHEFDKSRFPDPKAMVDELHAEHVQLMLSIWGKFYANTDNYKELDGKGYMYRRNVELGVKDWVGPGYLNSHYDPYSQEARDIYWRQIRDKLKDVGIDAWWADNTEPDIHSNTDREELTKRMGPTAIGPAEQYFNTYALKQAQAVYEGQRADRPDKRVFILTRSGFAGLQRYAAATWSGDIASRWRDLHNQVAAGTGISMSGMPNWTFDIGGFALEGRYSKQKPDPKDLAEWRELNLRWFQFGAFVPLFRSHGEFPLREIWNISPPGTEVYDSLVAVNRLRYRLLPYIYTLAGDTYHRDGTIMRGLVMDFPGDLKARNINDQYMFGPAFLVNPVYQHEARTRKVYLPAGTRWYDFYSGAAYDGGQQIDAAAPIAHMPLFVKAGSIVPVGPAVQYTAEKLDAPITLYVYRGANGKFELYEDDGLSYNYEQGQFARVPVSYDDASGTVTIGARAGSFPGMVEKRTFNVRWITPDEANAADLDAKPDASVEYAGQAVTVQLPQ